MPNIFRNKADGFLFGFVKSSNESVCGTEGAIIPTYKHPPCSLKLCGM